MRRSGVLLALMAGAIFALAWLGTARSRAGEGLPVSGAAVTSILGEDDSPDLVAPAGHEGASVARISPHHGSKGGYTVQGRVRDASTGRPMSAVIVECNGDTETRSGPGGEYRFEGVRRWSSELRVFAPPGWVPVTDEVDVDPDDARRGAEYDLLLEPATSDVVYGRVRDPFLDRPVPGLELRIGRRLLDESVVTDAEGRFVTRGAWTAGDLKVDVLQPGKGRRLERLKLRHRPDAIPPHGYVLEFAPGPEYELSLVGPARVSPARWSVRVVELDGEGWTAWSQGAILETAGASGLVARFATAERPAVDAEHAKLIVESKDGEWYAEVPIDTGSGPGRPPIAVPLQQFARLVVHVRDDRGRQIPFDSWLEPRGDERSRRPQFARYVSTSRASHGTYRAARMPGDYRLTVSPRNRAAIRVDVHLPPGVTELDDFVVPALDATGRITVEVELGSYSRYTTIWVRLRAADGRPVERIEYLEPSGGSTLHCELDSLPAGAYVLEPVCFDGGTLVPERATVALKTLEGDAPPTVSSAQARFEMPEDSTTRGLVFEVRDARTKELLEGSTVGATFVFGKVEHGRWSRIVLEGVPIIGWRQGSPLRWGLRVPGYRPAFGDRHAFERNGEELLARVELDPGWGIELIVYEGSAREAKGPLPGLDYWVHDESGQTPLQGVELLAGEVSLGRTDADGRLLATSEMDRSDLECRLAGWRVSETRGDPDRHPRWTVWMERE